MSNLALVANPALATSWAEILCTDGHTVDTFTNPMETQGLFSHDHFDILIIDVENPDFGETMLIPQTRSKWPDCKIVAVVSSYMFRTSAVYEMGLWSPDQLLLKPLESRLLLATVSFLWAQVRSREIKTAMENVKRTPAGLPIEAPQEASVFALHTPAAEEEITHQSTETEGRRLA